MCIRDSSATAIRTVNWTSDLVPPTFTGTYSPVTMGCNPLASDIDAALGSATATDGCSTATVTFTDGAISTSSCSSSQTRIFTAVDGCGNSATITRTVTWLSAPSPPTIIITPALITLGCNPSATDITAELRSATATAACSTTIVKFKDSPVQASDCSFSQVRTFIASDGCGNSATAIRTVNWTSDLVPPTFTGSYVVVPLGCNPAATDITAALGSASATDGCSTATITFTDGPVATASCSSSQTRIFTAVDGCGNTATTSRTVTWTSDLIPPTFTGSYVVVPLGCNPASSAIAAALGSASATDGCSAVTITSTDGAISTSSCSSSQTRIFTAVDGCGNSATITRTVTWLSAPSPPTIIITPALVTLGCNPSAADITAALGSATATAACSTPIVTFTDGAVTSNGCSFSQVRTFIASDGCGNSATAIRTVSYASDLYLPKFTGCYCPIVISGNPAGSDITTALGYPSVTNDCSTP